MRKKWALLYILGVVFLIAGCGSSASTSNSAPAKSTYSSQSSIPVNLPPVQTGWQRRAIPNIGSIDYPMDSMEEQNRAWRQSGQDLEKASGSPITPDDTVIIQQQGLTRYARIMIGEVLGTSGEFPKLTARNYVSQNELKDFTAQISRKLQNDFLKIPGMKLLEVYPASLRDINGMQALTISYRRQLDSNPSVLVWEYRFMNNDRFVHVVMSYRQSEDNIWAPIFRDSLASFRINSLR